jgi:hypothetical protein
MSDRGRRQKADSPLTGFEPPSFQGVPPREILDDPTVEHVDMVTLRLRLRELESENLALKTQVNRLVVSLSKTLLREAAG